MENKNQAIFDLLKKYKADSLISTSGVTREWLTGVQGGDFGLILAKNNQVHLFVDSRDIDNYKKYKLPLNIHLYTDINSWINFCKSQKLKHTLFESNLITYDQYATFVKPLNSKLTPFNGDELRIAKTPQEIKHLQKSADIICAAVEHLKKWITIGTTEIEAANELYKFVVNHGASGLSFPTIVSFGKNAGNIHNTPSNSKLKKNEIILVDAGCIYNGYCSDITRVWCIGKLSPTLSKMYDIVLKANLLGIKNAKANILGATLDSIPRNYIKDNWNGYDFPHGLGHGVGLLIHESPRAHKIYQKPIPVNSVLTIEPGIYDVNIGGIRIEDTVLITKTGCKILTNKSPK